MMETEFVRSLQSNYERIHLPEKPDDHRYQYCIVTRGGIKGLLPCSLRYINGQAYLYYDITSRQNVVQLCVKQLIDRKWVMDFFGSLDQVRQELGRFLLDEKNILIYPEQIFQDVTSHNFFFLYLPYLGENTGMKNLLEFMLEHMDYEDEKLVECVYAMYEQAEKLGDAYLQKQIFEDVKGLKAEEELIELQSEPEEMDPGDKLFVTDFNMDVEEAPEPEKPQKKSFWNRFGSKKKKAAERRMQYREDMYDLMEGIAVAEDLVYDEEDYGKTIYEEQPVDAVVVHKLYTLDGRVAASLESDSFIIGKQKEEADMVLDDVSISRIHARIYVEEKMVYLEDLNSTNGTFKNGLRLQPYEKRRLEEDDEIRFGKLLFVYR